MLRYLLLQRTTNNHSKTTAVHSVMMQVVFTCHYSYHSPSTKRSYNPPLLGNSCVFICPSRPVDDSLFSKELYFSTKILCLVFNTRFTIARLSSISTNNYKKTAFRWLLLYPWNRKIDWSIKTLSMRPKL